MITDLIPFMKSGERVPHDLMLRVLNASTDTMFTERERAAACEFSEEAARYLPSGSLLDFISGKIEDDECANIILKRRTLVTRMQDLAVPILAFFGDMGERSIKSVLDQLNDCYAAYHFVEASPYASVQRKTILTEVTRLVDQLHTLDALLDKTWRHIKIEYDVHNAAIEQLSKRAAYPTSTLDDLRNQLRMLRFSADLALYKDTIGESVFFTSDNKARTHIVETAYDLSLRFGSPRLVTTPGSDFSALCSLMFELATGTADESLAGAINRFARSDKRRETDREEAEFRHENIDEATQAREGDNFAHIRSASERLVQEARFWRMMRDARQWDDFSLQQITKRFANVRNGLDEAVNRHGPHIVWADQVGPTYRDEGMKEIWEAESKLLELAVELGRAVRARRLTDLPRK